MLRAFLFMVLIFGTGCSESGSKTSNNAQEKRAIESVQQSYQSAVQRAKDENKTLFILVESQNCRWCKRLRATTLQDKMVVQRLNEEFVFVTLDRNQNDYPEKLKPAGVPTVYMMDENEEIYTTVVGYRENPQEYLKWFDYIAIERGLQP